MTSPEVSAVGNHPAAYRSNLILTAAMMGVVLVSIDVSVVNVALEALQRSFETKMSGLQWILNIYTLAYAVFLLSAGALCDRRGARTTFLLGLGAFTLASLACGLAPSFPILLASRSVQGVGAALLIPSAMAMLRQAYSDPTRRAQAIGLWAGAGSLALAGGPVLGGALIGHFGWRSVFLMNLPIGLIGTWLASRFAPSSPRYERRDIDIAGQLVAAIALACFTGALTQAGDLGWSNPWVGGALLAGILLFIVFLCIERVTKHPMMPLTLFRSRAFSAAIWVGAVVNFAFYGLVFVFSLFFQIVQGRSAFETGLAFVPMTAIIMVVNIVAGRLIGARGSRLIMLAGLLIASGGYAAMLSIHAATPFWTIIPVFLIAGAGIALIVPSVMTTAISESETGRAGIGAGVLNSARQIGGAIGVALFGSIIGAVGSTAFVEGMHISIGLAVATFVASAAAVFVFIRS